MDQPNQNCVYAESEPSFVVLVSVWGGSVWRGWGGSVWRRTLEAVWDTC